MGLQHNKMVTRLVLVLWVLGFFAHVWGAYLYEDILNKNAIQSLPRIKLVQVLCINRDLCRLLGLRMVYCLFPNVMNTVVLMLY